MIPPVALARVGENLWNGRYKNAVRGILKFFTRTEVKDIISDIWKMEQNDEQRNKLKPEVDRIQKDRDEAFNDFNHYKKQAEINNCEHYGW